MRVNRHIPRLDSGHLWRLGVTLFALLAFTLQSYVAQTHTHKWTQPGLAGLALALDLDVPVKGKAPAKQDQNNCPLCQGIAHAGAYLTPAAAAALAPTLSVQIIAIALDTARAIDAVSHSWQSRGPPA